MNDLLTCVVDLAEQMLINGAEIFRVEDCINRIFHSYGVKRIDSFIITPSIIVSVYDNNGECFTQTRRITNVNTNINKLHKLNSLSRDICQNNPSIDVIKARLEEIDAEKTYSFFMRIFANAVIAGSFTLFFGGNISEFVTSFLIGAIMQVTYSTVSKFNTNRLFEKFICSLIVSLLTFLSVEIGIVESVDKIIIGNIMSMIPGVGFTNAIRDLFKGDIFTGVHRTIESLLISASIAAGYVITAIVFGGGLI